MLDLLRQHNQHKKCSHFQKIIYQVSKSANCLFDDDDDEDYDEPPPPSLALPPKLRPVLPPKQKINKSSEVVSFKTPCKRSCHVM